MTRRIAATATTTALVLAGAVAAAPSATAAPSAAPAATTASKSLTKRVDIDGDGRNDTVTLQLVSARGDKNGYRLTVRTATRRTSSRVVYVYNLNDATVNDIWVGASGFDGVRGNEILLDLGGGVGDFPNLITYTWRNGKLGVLVSPNGAARYPNWPITVPPFGVSGYTFSMKGSTRYVVHHELNPSKSGRGRSYSGIDTTYRWTPKGWKKVSSKRSGVLSAAAASKLGDFRGLIWR